MADGSLFHPIVAAVGLGLVGALAAPSVTQVCLRRKRRHNGGYEAVAGLFESRDGTATEESEKRRFSDREARVGTWISLFLGLGASIAAAVLLTLKTSLSAGWEAFNAWSDVAVWAILSAHCASIPTKAQYDWRFRLAQLCLASAAVELASLCFRFGYDAVETVARNRDDSMALAVAASHLLEMFAALAAGLAFASLPHRPEVYYQEALVDQQHAASLLSRFSFSWNRRVFDIAKERKLQPDDLPCMDGDTRSSSVYGRYILKEHKGKLWWELVKAFKFALAVQWSLTFVQAVLALFPQYVLFHFLEGLEQPAEERATDPKLWGWVAGLACSLVLQIWVSTTQRWNTCSRLEAPLLSLTQSLVFQKALRQDEAADPGQKADEKAQDQDKESSDASKQEKKPKPNTRQAVVNHIRMDSSRMTTFCTYNYWFPLATYKLFLAGSYLIKLLGWKALFSGLGCAIVIIPISHRMSKRYASIQFGLMAFRDAKTHTMTEALHGMRQIKYSALEDLYEKKILDTRNAELRQYWIVTLWMCALNAVVFLGPLLLSCVSLSVYAYSVDGHVKASVIFASLGLFDQLDEAIGLLPVIQVYLMEAWTSCVRIEKYLNQPDKSQVSTPGDSIAFIDATVRWPKVEDAESETPVLEDETRSILRNVTLDFPSGEMSVITGKTGSGKSLLLAAILGEVKLLSGSIHVPSPPPVSVIEAEEVADSDWILPTLTSFVSQTPWIEAGTVRENITFGMPFKDGRYKRVLRVCALEKDIELLVDGDATEVGPKGVTLSGGQRWRVALARALYSRAGILILDDVLSAVDAHVGRTIVSEALTGELAEGRTRILATHHAEMVLPRSSYLVRLRNGRLEKAEEVTEADVESSSGAAGESSTAASVSDDTAVGTQNGSNADESEQNGKTADKKAAEEERETGRVKWHVYRTYIKASGAWYLWTIAFALILVGRGIGLGATWSLKELSESYKTEKIDRALLQQAADNQAYFEDAYLRAQAAEEAGRRSALFWIGAYVLFCIASLINSIVNRIIIFIIGLKASKRLFEQMVHTVLRTPLRWADTMPIGRILNRFTQDTFTIDRQLCPSFMTFFTNIFTLVVIISTSIAVSPYVLVFGVILLFLYSRIARAYISVARDVKRINSVSHSPIFDQFSSVLSGLSTIRAFRRTEFYMKRMFKLIDNGAKTTWALQVLSRWMAFRMGMLGAVFVTTVAASTLVGNVDAALAGFALVFAFRYTGSLTMLLTNMTSVELGFNAAERVLEFIETKTEPQDGDDAPASWPSEGRVEVNNVSVGYAEQLPAVLQDITFEAKPGERIGIVGRTGAGKSTLAAVLFRLLELRQGSVLIDGIDISKIKLGQLRSRLAIIPQDPFLFSGTLRSNLDLEGSLDDYDLQLVLRRVHLIDPQAGDPERPSAYPPVDPAITTIAPALVPAPALLPAAAEPPEQNPDAPTETTPLLAKLDPPSSALPLTPQPATPEPPVTPPPPTTTTDEPTAADQQESNYAAAFTDLSTPISTGGGNLSQGQRQLVCLARALLTRPKIVVLDEATSAVDRGTDGAIQESLRREFAAGGCTVLVIAHRLSTVADFDRLLVLREGRVAEFGTPGELLRRGMGMGMGMGEGVGVDGEGAGAFWELVQRSAEREKLLEMILGAGEGGGSGGGEGEEGEAA